MTIVKNNGSVEAITKTEKFNGPQFANELTRNLKKNKKMGTLHETEKAILETLSKSAGGVQWMKKNA